MTETPKATLLDNRHFLDEWLDEVEAAGRASLPDETCRAQIILVLSATLREALRRIDAKA